MIGGGGGSKPGAPAVQATEDTENKKDDEGPRSCGLRPGPIPEPEPVPVPSVHDRAPAGDGGRDP